MRQDNKIALVLFLAFGVFITLRGELPAYMGFLLGKSSGTAGAQPQTAGDTITNALTNPRNLLNVIPGLPAIDTILGF